MWIASMIPHALNVLMKLVLLYLIFDHVKVTNEIHVEAKKLQQSQS